MEFCLLLEKRAYSTHVLLTLSSPRSPRTISETLLRTHTQQSEPPGEAPRSCTVSVLFLFHGTEGCRRATAGVRPGSSRLLLCVLRCCPRPRATPRAKMAGAAWTASSRPGGFPGRKWPLALAPQLSSERQHFLISSSTRHSVCPAKAK